MRNLKWLVPTLYIIFLMLPIYWLVSMSFKTTNEILGGFSLFPQNFTTENYVKIFTDPTWYWGYINSIAYVTMNTVLSVAVALPAAYAFSRYRFLGDKHLFFWLLTNRMAPAAVFALPFLQLYSSIGLFDTYLAVALPKPCSTSRWQCGFLKVSCPACQRNWTRLPMSTATRSRASSSAFSCRRLRPALAWPFFFCFMFSWVELLLAKTLTSVEAKPIAAVMTRTSSTSGYELGLLAAAGSLTIIPGAIVIWFVRNYIAKVLRSGASDRES